MLTAAGARAVVADNHVAQAPDIRQGAQHKRVQSATLEQLLHTAPAAATRARALLRQPRRRCAGCTCATLLRRTPWWLARLEHLHSQLLCSRLPILTADLHKDMRICTGPFLSARLHLHQVVTGGTDYAHCPLGAAIWL